MILTTALLRTILRNREQFEWTVQGFGMIRTYLDRDQRWRLNIWDNRLTTSNVSRIHDHPWSFTSFIQCGLIENRRYSFMQTYDLHLATHCYKEIVTGPDGEDKSNVRHCEIVPKRLEFYMAGDTYSQKLDEVHETVAHTGTVTLNDRTTPTEHYTARVFWPLGTEWVGARPRPAEGIEVARACAAALQVLS
jgi:hypothetical protein